MYTINYRLPLLALTLIVALVLIKPVLAHGDEPRLEIGTERINPGGVIEVRGVGFEFEEIVALALVGEAYELPLGEIAADTDGVFLQFIALPTDLKVGIYHFRAVTDDHEVKSPALTVEGSVVVGEVEVGQQQREHEEVFAVPVPTYPPGVIPGVVPGTTQSSAPTGVDSAEPTDPSESLILMPGLLALTMGAIFFILRSRKK